MRRLHRAVTGLSSNRHLQTHAPQLVKFAVCGGLGSVIDLGSLTLFVEYFAMESRVAVIPSTLLAVTFVFLTNKYFTFKNKEKNYASQVVKFALVYGVAVLSNVAISAGLITIGVHYLLSKVIAIAIGAVWNYSLSHGFVFRKGETIDAVVG